MLLQAGRLAVVVFGLFLCSNASAEEVVSPSACPAGVRLRAVQFDPNHDERSFVVFAGSPLRAPPLRIGSRVGSYAIERIERGGAVLVAHAQRCSVRLQGAQVEHELRAVSVAAVRSGLRSHAASPLAHIERAQLVVSR